MAEKKPVATFPGLFSLILLILALAIATFGFYDAYFLKAQELAESQMQALEFLQYLGSAIMLLLIAILIKLK